MSDVGLDGGGSSVRDRALLTRVAAEGALLTATFRTTGQHENRPRCGEE